MGTPCSEETKRKISFAKTGIHRTAEERKFRRYETNRAHHNRCRQAAFEKLGNRCASLNCRWQNPDGTFGCTDIRILQVDHVKGGGYQERKNLNQTMMYILVLKDQTGKYQALCPNCNWLKRVEEQETRKRAATA